MFPASLTTFGCKPTNRALTWASARSFAERNMPGCASWSWPTNLRSSKNGNVLNYKQASRRQLASGVIDHTPANLRLWLKSPQHVKPGALMPDFTFTDEQLDQLSAYLSTLR